jgi:hypothetical protein
MEKRSLTVADLTVLDGEEEPARERLEARGGFGDAEEWPSNLEGTVHAIRLP